MTNQQRIALGPFLKHTYSSDGRTKTCATFGGGQCDCGAEAKIDVIIAEAAKPADLTLGAGVRAMRDRIDHWLVTDGTEGCIEIIHDIAALIMESPK